MSQDTTMQRIALLCGGTSSERDISLRSGANVADALRNIGHTVTVHDLTADSLEGTDLSDASFAFIVMHGGWGEGGGVQAELERIGIPYSGSDACSSRLALDKELTKAAFLRQRVPTPEHDIVTRGDAAARAARFTARHGYPVAVKPVTQGSSIGVSIVRDGAGMGPALEEAFRWDQRVMLERGIVGRELTVAIIGARAYPVIEVAPCRDFYDYSAKYADPGTRYITRPELDPVVEKTARHIAKRAHNSVRCHGYSRIDMMLDSAGGLHVLEVNTLPGMTNRSLLPLAAAQAGMSYDETLQAMIDASLAPRRRISEAVTGDSRAVRSFTA
jgi:D-alanine-D-alanine ligase